MGQLSHNHIRLVEQRECYGWLFSACSIISAALGSLRIGLKRKEHAYWLHARSISKNLAVTHNAANAARSGGCRSMRIFI